MIPKPLQFLLLAPLAFGALAPKFFIGVFARGAEVIGVVVEDLAGFGGFVLGREQRVVDRLLHRCGADAKAGGELISIINAEMRAHLTNAPAKRRLWFNFRSRQALN